MSIHFLIPFFTMSISCILIFIRVKKSNENYSSFLVDDNYKSNSKIYRKKIQKNNRIIYVLLIVNSYFFFSILPYFIFNIFVDEVYSEKKSFFKILVNILFYSNNAFNVFFYGFSSQKYRQEFVDILKRSCTTVSVV